MPKAHIVMDTSQYDMFRLCEARFNMRYNMNRTLPSKPKALDRGTLVHLACETYYQCIKDGAKYDYAVNAAIMKVKVAGAVSSDLDSEEIDRIVEVMEEYFDYWRTEDQNLHIVEVEKPFIYKLFEDDNVVFHLAGKIDLIVNTNRYTNLPYDHKSFDRSYEAGRMGNQFPNYCTATGSNFLVLDKIGFQKTLKPHEKYLRTPLTYDDLRLEQWRQNVIKVMFQYLTCVAENSWPMNETSCDKFNRRCEYYEVCDSSGEEAKKFKLANNYIEIEPWDVSKVLRKTSEQVAEKEEKKDV